MHMIAPDLFPPCRIPSKFAMPTHLFKQSFTITFTPTTSRFHAVCIPSAINSQPTLGVFTPNTFGTNQTYTAATNCLGGGSNEALTARFTAVRVVSCVIKTEFVGSELNRRGFFIAGMSFIQSSQAAPALFLNPSTTGVSVYSPTIQETEDMFFATEKKVEQGIRMVYLPKDPADLEFTSTQGNAFATGSSRTQVLNIVGTGLNPEVDSVKIHVCRYLEGIPLPAEMDLLLPMRGDETGYNVLESVDQIDPSATVTPVYNNKSSFLDDAVSFIGKAINIGEKFIPYGGAALSLVSRILSTPK